MAEKLRVLVVEDSLTVRRRICEVLSSEGAINVGTTISFTLPGPRPWPTSGAPDSDSEH